MLVLQTAEQKHSEVVGNCLLALLSITRRLFEKGGPKLLKEFCIRALPGLQRHCMAGKSWLSTHSIASAAQMQGTCTVGCGEHRAVIIACLPPPGLLVHDCLLHHHWTICNGIAYIESHTRLVQPRLQVQKVSGCDMQ